MKAFFLGLVFFVFSTIALADEDCEESTPPDCDGWTFGWSILPWIDGENQFGLVLAPQDRVTWKVHMAVTAADSCDVSGHAFAQISMPWNGPRLAYMPNTLIYLEALEDITFELQSFIVPDVPHLEVFGIWDALIFTCPENEVELDFITFRPVTKRSDTSRNLSVGLEDVVFVLENWSTDNFRADVNLDGIVDTLDLVQVILDFGWTH